MLFVRMSLWFLVFLIFNGESFFVDLNAYSIFGFGLDDAKSLEYPGRSFLLVVEYSVEDRLERRIGLQSSKTSEDTKLLH